MFVSSHPLTHTGHLSRTYSSQTTSKNTNKENANALPSKTPSRAGPSKLVPSTSVRVGLGVKTVERNMNALVDQPATGKGKGGDAQDIEPKRLFQSTIQPSSSKTHIGPSRSLSSLSLTQSRQPNTHKTPLPSRRLPPSTSRNALRTPAPGRAIPPTPTPLPSASRTRRRSRQSLTPLRPSVSEESFVTPPPSGRWEEENSLESIAESLGRLDVGLDGVAEVEEEGSEDEVEYMPPTATQLPWEPAWSYPDPVPIFQTFMSLPPLWTPRDDMKPSLPEVPDMTLEEEPEVKIRLCSDEDLEEPMFRRKVTTVSRPDPKQGLSSRAPASRPTVVSGGARKAPLPSTARSSTRPVTSSVPSTAGTNVPPGARHPVATLPTRTAPAAKISRPPMPSFPVTKTTAVPPKLLPRQPARIQPARMEKRDMEIDNAMLLDFGDEPFGSEEVVYDLGLGEE